MVENGDEPKNVLKIFLKTRHDLRTNSVLTSWKPVTNPAIGSINSYIENPEFFPRAYEIGEGKVFTTSELPELGPKMEFDVRVIRQRFIPNAEYTIERYLKEEGRYTSFVRRLVRNVLYQWFELTERNEQPLPSHLQSCYENEKCDEKFQAVADSFYDRAPGLYALYSISRLKDSLPFLKNYRLPESTISLSKICGDFSIRQLLTDGKYITYDTEKYGVGEPARDLSLMVEDVLIKQGKERAMDFISEIVDVYGDERLILPMERAAVGHNAERALTSLPDRFGLRFDRGYFIENLRANIEFYHDVKRKYFHSNRL